MTLFSNLANHFLAIWLELQRTHISRNLKAHRKSRTFYQSTDLQSRTRLFSGACTDVKAVSWRRNNGFQVPLAIS